MMPDRLRSLVVLAFLGLTLPAVGQDAGRKLVRDETPESLQMDLLGFATGSPDTSRLDVYIHVGYDLLSFVKDDDRYNASYEVTLTLFDSADAPVTERTWVEQVSNLTFEETVSSSAYQLVRRSLMAVPGIYSVTCAIRDLDTKATTRIRKKQLLRKFAPDPISMSDMMLLSKVVSTGARRSITPNIAGNVGDYDDPFGLFFEVYTQGGSDTVRCEVVVKGKEQALRYRHDTLLVVHAQRNDVILQVPHDSLGLGDYLVAVALLRPHHPPPGERVPLAAAIRPIIVRWAGVPRSVKDIDLAIEQLMYIARDAEADRLRAAHTLEEKQKAFVDFWRKRDPNPSTPRNEKMLEFYQRVEYANKHFSHYREGWRTDMGMVYIIFGPPGAVDRHPFEMDSKPYEIWSYFDLNFSAVFVDQTGFGDYRLITPITEILSRRRDQ
jgi:GWxTD domain-containing protein